MELSSQMRSDLVVLLLPYIVECAVEHLLNGHAYSTCPVRDFFSHDHRE